MSNVNVECRQEIIAGYKLPNGTVGTVHFKPLEVNSISKDLFDLLRSQKGGLVERALESRVLIPRSQEEARDIALGHMPFEVEKSPRSPAQAAAEVLAKTQSMEKATEAAEKALEVKEPKRSR